jgi:hypothetical protein
MSITCEAFFFFLQFSKLKQQKKASTEEKNNLPVIENAMKFGIGIWMCC